MRIKILITLLICSLPLFAQNNGNLMNKFSLAQSYENSGDPGKALIIYQELYQLNPDNNIYFESLNRVYLQLKNYAASVDLIEKEILKRPEDITLYGLLGSSYYLMGNEEKAYHVWDDALAGQDNNPVFYRVIANYAVERRAFEKAIDLFRRGKEISKDKTIFSYDLARLYSLTMQYEAAAEEYCSILLADEQQLPTVENKVFTFVNKPEALSAFIKVVKKYDDRDNFSLLYLLARLYIENKDYNGAFGLYKELDQKKSQDGAELYRYAASLFRMGEHDISKKVYKSIFEIYPKSPLVSSAKLGFAKSSEAILMKNYSEKLPLWKPYFRIISYESDEINQVISAFTEITSLYKNSEAAFEALLRIGMIKLYLQNNREEAAKYFTRIIDETSVSKSTADAYNGLGEIAILEGDLIQAEKNYSKNTSLSGNDVQKTNDSKYKLARIKFYEGDFKQAQKLIADVLKNLKDDNANDALELSMLLNTAKFDSSNLMIFAEGEFLADQKRFSEAAEKYKLVADNQKAFLLHSIASIRLAEMKIADDDYQQAIEMLEKVTEEGEKNIYADKAVYLLAQLYQYGVLDNTKAIEKYEQLLAKFPSSLYIDKARAEIIKLKEKIS